MSMNREELQHPELIKAALNYGLPLDLAPFEIHLGQFTELRSGLKFRLKHMLNMFEYLSIHIHFKL